MGDATGGHELKVVCVDGTNQATWALASVGGGSAKKAQAPEYWRISEEFPWSR